VLLAVVIFAVHGGIADCADAQLESRRALIRAAGDPASIADLAPPSVPDDENAAVILERIGPRLSEFSSDYARFLNTPIGQSYEQAQDRGEPASPQHIFEIRLILIEHEDVEVALAQAAARDKYASRLNYSLNYTGFMESPFKHDVRTAGRFLAWRMEVLIADGFCDDAVRNGIDLLRLARHNENEPLLVPFLIAIAVRNLSAPQMYDALAAGPMSPELYAALDRELALSDRPQQIVNVMKSERAVSADWAHDYLASYPLLPSVCVWVINSEQWGLLDEIDAHLQLAEMPWHEVRTRIAPSESVTPPSKRGKLADSLLPGLQAVIRANARDIAVTRSLRIYNALRKFSDKHGREATGLDELSLPASATIDPYSGEPLKMKHTDDGWVVYSVMENVVDDGGDFIGRKDYGVAPRKLRLTE
jgi:hypothetical protein